MKNLFLIIINFALYNCAFAQFNPPQQITAGAINVASVYSADFDGDGDNDVLSSSFNGNTIAWFRNLDGLGDFGEAIILATEPYGTYSAIAVDLDGDNDMDVLAAIYDIDSIAWFENLDGQGNFSPLNIINASALGAVDVESTDLNNDGYKDVLFASRDDNKVAWHENISGTGEFGPEQIISNNNGIPLEVIFGDLDNDGDMDVISTSFFDDRLVWHENLDGNGTFSDQNIIYNQYVANSIGISDLDYDGDLDILQTGHSIVAWHENLDGQGSFGPRIDIDNDLSDGDAVTTADINNDGFVDIIVSSSWDDVLYWYDNEGGEGDFGESRIIANLDAARDIFTSDINGDGIVDVITASGSRVYWIENTGILDVSQNLIPTYNLVPNPTSGLIKIVSNFEIDRISVFDLNGRLLATKKKQNEINISSLQAGLYLLKIEDINGVSEIKKVIKK